MPAWWRKPKIWGGWAGLVVLSLLFVASCAGSRNPDSVPSADAPAASGDEAADAVKPDEPVVRRPPPRRPNIALNEDLLYRFLLAEIAGYRGRLDVSLSHYLHLALVTRDPEVVERATRIALHAGDDQAARRLAVLWRQLDAHNPVPLQVLAVMAIREQDLQRAVHYLRQGMANMSGSPEQKFWLIVSFLGREIDRQGVAWVMEQLAEDYPEHPDVLFALAQVVGRLGNTDRALILLTRVLQLMPGNEAASAAYLSFLGDEVDNDRALARLEEVLADNPDSFLLRRGYAALLANLHRSAEARTQLLSLLEQHPGNPQVLYSLGVIDFRSARLQQAEGWFMRLYDSGQYISESNYYLGRIAEQQRDLPQAISRYQGVVGGRHHLDARIRISLVVARQGEVDKARQQLRNIQWHSDDERLLLIQGEVELLSEARAYHQALALLDQTIAEQAHDDLLYARALLAEKMGRIDILEHDLRTLLAADPDNATVLNALGYSLADNTERHEEAYALIARALQLSPNDFHILDSMGWVLYHLGRLAEAEQFLRQAIALRHDPEIAAHLGEVLWAQGNRQEAQRIWDDALQRTPENDHLLEVMQRLKP